MPGKLGVTMTEESEENKKLREIIEAMPNDHPNKHLYRCPRPWDPKPLPEPPKPVVPMAEFLKQQDDELKRIFEYVESTTSPIWRCVTPCPPMGLEGEVTKRRARSTSSNVSRAPRKKARKKAAPPASSDAEDWKFLKWNKKAKMKLKQMKKQMKRW
jgi:hypothetical protein